MLTMTEAFASLSMQAGPCSCQKRCQSLLHKRALQTWHMRHFTTSHRRVWLTGRDVQPLQLPEAAPDAADVNLRVVHVHVDAFAPLMSAYRAPNQQIQAGRIGGTQIRPACEPGRSLQRSCSAARSMAAV